MEDFIEIIFYVIIFLISGLGSILKKRNDNKEESTPKPMFQTEDEINDTTAPIGTFDESELIRKLREIEITETKQHEEELISEQELKVKEEAEDIFRKQERIRRENELKIQQEVLEHIENSKMQIKIENSESDITKVHNPPILDLNLTEADVARRAFLASEIFNKKYY
jgi:hypothetical protein